jgi:hypothetical protein
MVPSNMVNVAVTSNMLFIKKKLSFEKKLKEVLSFILGEFFKYNINADPVIIAKNNKIKAPLAGSLAKECTDVKIPDLTKKVPSKLNENAMIDSKIVQFLNMDFCSHVISECIKAVVINHGMKDAFSTGSQNHQPPQPSS